jgi:hypothetical protein
MAKQTHPSYCRKEKEIAEMHTDLRHIKRVVMGNGKDGLDTTVPILSDNVETLKEETIPALRQGISAFLKFMNEEEGRQAGKAQIRRRTQWVIGTLAGITVSLLGLLIALILKM